MSTSRDDLAEPEASAELFEDFANTLEFERGRPVDAIAGPRELLAWLTDRGLISERVRAAEASRLRRDAADGERRLERFRELRRLLHAVARRTGGGQPPTRQQVRDLNHILRHGLHYHQLRPTGDGTRYAVTQIGDRLDQARAAIASSMAHFLAGGTPERLRVCANQGCRYVFVDRSPSGRRRWCDMRTCGNQAKVARHRARAKARGELV